MLGEFFSSIGCNGFTFKDELVLIGIRVGSHDRLFPGQNRAKRYRKNDE